ncbi:MAG: tRNA glutamyl-Q(34) synthetase GluQRS [Rhodoferax sp.]|nr:tRNA glutamyl-Q(34) synthetase GluQRS [Rhodoferax sp.]
MPASHAPYRGRFAPSPTGPLHAGSLLAALASWLDARAHRGQWLVRMEDVDTPRCVPGADHLILHQLANCGLVPDEAPVWQSQRQALYRQALDRLLDSALAYPCACSRKDIAHVWAARNHDKPRHAELVYPGTCRTGLQGRAARAWRFRTDGLRNTRADAGPRSDGLWHWSDRRLGQQAQDIAQEVGDFVLLRADGLWAYQLAVVVDDAAQGITHVVRGEDLADNTPRQLALQRALGAPAPQYLHTPLVRGADGEKLSKQHGAPALDVRHPLDALNRAAQGLGLGTHSGSVDAALACWTREWAQRYVRDSAWCAAPCT